MLQGKCIDVEDCDAVAAHQQSRVCTDLKCRKCGAKFRFFYGGPCSYIGKVQEEVTSQTLPSEASEAIPSVVMSMITKVEPPRTEKQHDSLDKADEDLVNEDADFDMIFGNRGLPVVGSYKHHMAFNDRIFGMAEMTPKSYYA